MYKTIKIADDVKKEIEEESKWTGISQKRLLEDAWKKYKEAKAFGNNVSSLKENKGAKQMEYTKVRKYTAYHIVRNYTSFKAVFRNIRKDITNCHMCDKKFQNNEIMDLTLCHKGGNKFICSNCGDELLEKELI